MKVHLIGIFTRSKQNSRHIIGKIIENRTGTNTDPRLEKRIKTKETDDAAKNWWKKSVECD